MSGRAPVTGHGENAAQLPRLDLDNEALPGYASCSAQALGKACSVRLYFTLVRVRKPGAGALIIYWELYRSSRVALKVPRCLRTSRLGRRAGRRAKATLHSAGGKGQPWAALEGGVLHHDVASPEPVIEGRKVTLPAEEFDSLRGFLRSTLCLLSGAGRLASRRSECLLVSDAYGLQGSGHACSVRRC